MTQDTEKLTISVEEAAKLLGISRGLAFELCRRNELPHVRLGKRILIPKVSLNKMLSGDGPERG